MQNIQSSLIARSNTMFGVCEALGEDFGISPNWFRVVFAAGVIYNLEWAVAAYIAVGLLVAVSRFFYPAPKRKIEADEASLSSKENEQSGEMLSEAA